MADVILQYSATIVNLPAPDHPEEPGEELHQNTMVAMGGRVTSVTRAAGLKTRPILHYTDLDETDYNALRNFINNTVVGSKLSFTYTDWDSVAHTARYLSGIPGRSNVFDSWSVDLELMIISTP